MKLLIIGNPIAGGGKARKLIEEMSALLKERGYRADTFLTSSRGDAEKKAAGIDLSYDVLVVCGGDGTLNEVLNGLRSPGEIPLAFFPAGTGNVVAHELNLCSDPGEILAAIERGKTRRLDMGIANGRRFLMVASAGFDAAVIREIQRSRKGKLGYMRYILPVLRTVFKYSSARIEVRVDGLEPVIGAMVLILKTPYYGGVFTVDREAGSDSGFFHISVFKSGSLFSLAQYGITACRGRLTESSKITYLKGVHVELLSDESVPVEIDGDFAGLLPLTCDLKPAAISFFV